jgi:hypothetical protein
VVQHRRVRGVPRILFGCDFLLHKVELISVDQDAQMHPSAWSSLFNMRGFRIVKGRAEAEKRGERQGKERLNKTHGEKFEIARMGLAGTNS